eukprot:c25678_g4_i1 orf=3-416(-)
MIPRHGDSLQALICGDHLSAPCIQHQISLPWQTAWIVGMADFNLALNMVSTNILQLNYEQRKEHQEHKPCSYTMLEKEPASVADHMAQKTRNLSVAPGSNPPAHAPPYCGSIGPGTGWVSMAFRAGVFPPPSLNTPTI